jgi:hypothetical protein
MRALTQKPEIIFWCFAVPENDQSLSTYVGF